jgi:hypothetical protein
MQEKSQKKKSGVIDTKVMVSASFPEVVPVKVELLVNR